MSKTIWSWIGWFRVDVEEYPKPQKERRIIRSVINQTNPNILAIQEIGERFYLNELWKDLNKTNAVRFKYSAWLPGVEGEQGI